ncbi:MAG: hypothetical protein QOE86_612 [Solirubrobacteraceae bacterium]|jgi:hypothetical protein|nr:hypothetical protein [Solirubrobacteraceae bacterium]
MTVKHVPISPRTGTRAAAAMAGGAAIAWPTG